MTVSTYTKINNEVFNTRAALSIKTTDVRLHTNSLSPNTPKIALFSAWGNSAAKLLNLLKTRLGKKGRRKMNGDTIIFILGCIF